MRERRILRHDDREGPRYLVEIDRRGLLHWTSDPCLAWEAEPAAIYRARAELVQRRPAYAEALQVTTVEAEAKRERRRRAAAQRRARRAGGASMAPGMDRDSAAAQHGARAVAPRKGRRAR